MQISFCSMPLLDYMYIGVHLDRSYPIFNFNSVSLDEEEHKNVIVHYYGAMLQLVCRDVMTSSSLVVMVTFSMNCLQFNFRNFLFTLLFDQQVQYFSLKYFTLGVNEFEVSQLRIGLISFTLYTFRLVGPAGQT